MTAAGRRRLLDLDRLSGHVTLAQRIALLTAFAVGLTLAVASLTVFLALRVELSRSLDESLMERARATAQSPLYRLSQASQLPTQISVATDVRPAVVTDDGVARGDVDLISVLSGAEVAVARGEARSSLRTVVIGQERFRVAAVPQLAEAGERSALVLAQSKEPTFESLERLGVAAWSIGAAGVLLAGLAGWAVASNGLRPVRRLTAAAEHVARTDDLTPIPPSGVRAGRDELVRLTSAFNMMLASLAMSRQRQNQLIADAGHELRTPLTSLRTNLELLVQADRSGGLPGKARAELLADVGAQIDELSQLVGDLVELNRDDPLQRDPEPVDLVDVVDAAVDRVRRRAPAGVVIDVQADQWLVLGERPLLERAVTNLLDNAVKWSPPRGRVEVRLHGGVLTVRDHGPGIAAEDLPHVFERFYRSVEARTLSGSGLGLAIVRRTADRHGGQVTAGNAPGGGAVLTLTLPGEGVRPPPAAHS
jgi:two-component system sensor histidine kinase MprB